MTNETNQPVEVIRDGIDGRLKATIWSNDSDRGVFYSIEFSRTYDKDGELQDSRTFTGSEVLQISRLAEKAYDRISELTAREKEERKRAA